MRFPGQYYDAETGLSYNYARDYDPVTARYGESDPIGLKGGVNTYSYANASPVSNIDPAGRLFYTNPMIENPMGAAATVAWAAGTAIGTIIYNAYSTQIQDALEHAFPYPTVAGAPVPSAAAAPPLPPAANDPEFGGGDCPPDCRAFRELLNRMYQALVNAEAVPGLTNSLDVHWQQFNKSVRAYEKQCGPYTPPPSLHDIYIYIYIYEMRSGSDLIDY
jgi:RHS repeat-associated protein